MLLYNDSVRVRDVVDPSPTLPSCPSQAGATRRRSCTWSGSCGPITPTSRLSSLTTTGSSRLPAPRPRPTWTRPSGGRASGHGAEPRAEEGLRADEVTRPRRMAHPGGARPASLLSRRPTRTAYRRAPRSTRYRDQVERPAPAAVAGPRVSLASVRQGPQFERTMSRTSGVVRSFVRTGTQNS